MSQLGYRIGRWKDFIITALMILIPMLVIVGQSETGSALVYVGFIFMLYREGLSGWLIFMVGMAILLFILTLTASPFSAVLVLGSVSSLCICLYSGRFRWWLIICIPLIVLFAFLPSIMEGLAAIPMEAGAGLAEDTAEAAAEPSLISKIKPLYILLGAMGIAAPFLAFRAFRERNMFTHLAIITTIAGIILVFSVDFLFNSVLQDHQRKRIEVLLGMKEDPSGVGYNVNQSMIAIGSGGFSGKGYLNGTQTTFGFVPEQSTDFIFCTIGEEWGFAGCTFVILLYVFLMWKIVKDAERSREAFTRIYGYCVACCFFMHVFINIGMTMGLVPVIGIPLPLLSYGGSSLWSFTVLLFIFIKLDMERWKR
jgi:rod shape determining protein RodA